MGAQQSTQLAEIVNNVSSKVISTENRAVNNLIQYNNQTIQRINFFCEECIMKCPGGVQFKNTGSGKVVIAGNFTDESTRQIKNELSAELVSSIQQTFSKELGVLGGAFNYSQDEVKSILRNEVSNLIENTVNTVVLNNALASVSTIQDNNVTFKKGILEGNDCIVSNESIANAQLSLTAQSISDTVVKGLLKTKIAQDIKQDYDFKAAGLEAFTSAIIFIIIALILLGGGFAWKGSSLVTNPQNLKLVLGASGVFILVVLIYYKTKSKAT